MKFGVIVFPGSNCDKDMVHIIKNVLNKEVVEIWHKETELKNFDNQDCIIFPGGFSFGDYLRTGAIARFSPIIPHIVDFANNGGKILGICNGFQVLCELGLLDGVLLRNKDQKFVCDNKFLKIRNNTSIFTQFTTKDQVIKIPVAHAEGRYYADNKTLEKLEKNNQILFEYSSSTGEVSEKYNFNGAEKNIAGIMNEKGNVFGMMPHPERASEEILGNTDGLALMKGLI